MRTVFCLLLAATIFIPGCSQPADRVAITEIREMNQEEQAAMPVLGTASRLGLEPSGPQRAPTPHNDDQPLPESGVMESAPLDPAHLHWQAPDGWRRGEERPMRLATYMPAATEATECAVTLLPGMAGGITANLNRWRAQLDLGPMSDDDILALPRLEMLGEQAAYLSVADAGGTVKLYGVICPIPGGLLFVKMTGPIHEMEPERERFEAFCRSMHVSEEQ